MTSLAHTWRSLLLPAVTASVAVGLASWVVFRVNGGGDFLDAIINNPEGFQRLPDEVVADLSRPFYLASAEMALLQIAGYAFIALATHRVIAGQMRGASPTGAHAWRQAVRRYPAGFGATVLAVVTVAILLWAGLLLWVTPILSVGTPNLASVLVAALLLLALIGPGVWAAVALSMMTPAVALEDIGVLDSVRRSMRLVRGRWWATAGFLAIVGLLGGVAIVLVQMIALPLLAGEGGNALLTIVTVLGVLTQGMLMVAITGMCTHWYLDLRARKEGPAIPDLG